MNDSLDFGEVIHTYSRAEARDDGSLVDASALAREAGIRFPVALTRSAWWRCVKLTPEAADAGNDETGRLWDVLWMLANAIRRQRAGGVVRFEVSCVTTRRIPGLVQLRAVVGPGDDAEAVITVMLPGES